MALTLEDIDHIHVHVSDRAAAEAWYARVLGLRRLVQLEFWAADGGPLTISNVSGTIHLALFERQSRKSDAVVALSASGAQFLAWRAHLATELAKPIEVVDHEVAWSLYFVDPDQNPYEITSYDHEEIRSALKP